MEQMAEYMTMVHDKKERTSIKTFWSYLKEFKIPPIPGLWKPLRFGRVFKDGSFEIIYEKVDDSRKSRRRER